MINSEKDLEDYICENQEEFIKSLKDVYRINQDIKFVGRQVYIGEHNIADLIYYYELKEEIKDKEGNITDEIIIKNFIIVELKFRNISAIDLGQISRYMTTFQDKIYDDEVFCTQDIRVYGVLVGFDLDDNMQEIQMFLENFSESENYIRFISINSNIVYKIPSYQHKEKYIQNLKLDERLIDAICE